MTCSKEKACETEDISVSKARRGNYLVELRVEVL